MPSKKTEGLAELQERCDRIARGVMILEGLATRFDERAPAIEAWVQDELPPRIATAREALAAVIHPDDPIHGLDDVDLGQLQLYGVKLSYRDHGAALRSALSAVQSTLNDLDGKLGTLRDVARLASKGASGDAELFRGEADNARHHLRKAEEKRDRAAAAIAAEYDAISRARERSEAAE